jgi:hypothetical protein
MSVDRALCGAVHGQDQPPVAQLQEISMAKGQKRTTKEIRKPKAEKPKPAQPVKR